MRKLIIIVLFLILSCRNKKLSKNYRGYVFNTSEKPLQGVKVYAFGYPLKYTNTNGKGYFSLDRRSMNFVDNLIFKKTGYYTDTIIAFSATRRRDKTHFLTKRSDTLFMIKNLNKSK